MLRHFSWSVQMSPDDHAYPPIARARNGDAGTTTVPSVCPHDCTSTCALDVERLSRSKIGRVRGSMRNDYTAGVICEKVARYAERIHHPDRLMKPLRRVGPKGSKQFAEISWTDALDIVAEQFIAKARQHGSEAVWPYLLRRHDGPGAARRHQPPAPCDEVFALLLHHLRDAVGYRLDRRRTGAKRGVDVREIDEHAELVVIWGGNPVNTQVNVMTHAMKAKKRGAKLVVVDPYRTGTAEQADIHLCGAPGTDGALACARHARAVQGGLRRLGLPAQVHRRAGRAGRASRHPHAGMGRKITGLSVERSSPSRASTGTSKALFIRCHHGFSRSATARPTCMP
jgi:anaerobic selenocysteine-containing dehydrogenase